MRVPEFVKDHYRYYRILRRFKVKNLKEYISIFRSNNAVKILDLLPFTPEVIFDVGAYKGKWTQSFCNIIGSKAKYYLFEPIPSFYEDLKSTFKTSEKVSIYNLAFSSEKGFKIFNVAESPDFSSIESVNQNELDLHYPKLGLNFIDKIRVETDTLDHFYEVSLKDEFIDLLKLDVQGHELRVLEGGIRTLERTKSILIEWNIVNYYASDADFTYVHKFLREVNFALSSIPFQYRANGQLMYADALYINKRH